MKRGLCFLVAVCLLVLSACGNGKGSEASSQPPSSIEASEPPASSSPPPQAGPVGESERAEDAYFDDAVFIGDSATNKLQSYVKAKQASGGTVLGKAQFLTNGLLGCANTLRELGSKDSIHPEYEGNEMYVEDAVLKIGAKKVYIMLGHNDVALYGNEETVKNMGALIAKIKEKSPEAEIFVQGVTPIVADKDGKSFSNANFKAYNDLLSTMCQTNGYHYVDSCAALQLENGSLNPDYCSDPQQAGFHLSDKGCEAWVEYLYTHTV